MAWGKGGAKGVSDLVDKLRANTTGKTLMIMRFRTFGTCSNKLPYILQLPTCLFQTKATKTSTFHNIGPSEVSDFCQALAENHSLEELFCSGHSLPAVSAEAFGAALRKNRSLKFLSLGCSALGDEGLLAILKDWDNAVLETLDLEFKGLGVGGLRGLRNVLCTECNLREIRLGRNELDDEAVEELAQGVEKSYTLTKLLLDQNSFTAAGCRALGFALARNQGPKREFCLDLANNGFGDDGLLALLSERDGEREGFSGVDVVALNVEGCGIGSDGIVGLDRLLRADNASCFKQLRALNLARNEIREVGALVEHESLRELNLMGNKLGVEGVLALAKGFANSRVESLHLGDVKFRVDSGTLEESKEALTLLAQARSLKSIWFLGNQLSDMGAGHLAACLETNPQLETLGLSATGLSSDGCLQLLTTLEKNTSIRTIEIGGHAFDERVQAAVDSLKERMPQRDVALDKGQKE